MIKFTTLGVIAASVFIGAGAAYAADPEVARVVLSSAQDRDCNDFGSQAEAQAFFRANGGPADDPHRLDADDDGVACEQFGVPDPGDTETVPPAAPAQKMEEMFRKGDRSAPPK